jgi:uncharacterized protein YbjT (DUF2867 family)/uncharacterized membrane protein YphA (DoxX/SURF4 family)
VRVLLTGATGFIGSHLALGLRAAGHVVVCAARASARNLPPGCSERVNADFTRDLDPSDWAPKLAGMDAVVNAVGILREQGQQTFELVHVRAPCALFDACVLAQVSRVLNISALGADDRAVSAYHLSKRRADEHLRTLPLAWTIVQPSLVYGVSGTSAQLFNTLASAPILALPGGGRQRLQPIHIDDVVAGIRAALESKAAQGRIVPFVGPEQLSLRDYLQQLRGAMGLQPARVISVPLSAVHLAARVGEHVPGSLIDRETLGMLERGNTGDAAPITALLHRRPRPVGEFIRAEEAQFVRRAAQLSWLLPILRISIAIVWIVTGIVSLGLYPVEESYRLLERVGVPAILAPLFLYGAAALDLALGFATLLMRKRRMLWLAQCALILFYTVMITLRLPEFWLHPYGPLLKNLPMLAAIAALYVLERR